MAKRLVSALDTLGLLTSNFEFSDQEIRDALGAEGVKAIETAAKKLRVLVEFGSGEEAA